MSAREEQQGQQPSEAELRAAYEAEIKKIRVEHVLLEHVVTLVNLGMRRTGLVPGTEAERDPAQVQLAIEAIRALLPLVEQAAPEQAAPIRDALSQLQLAYVRVGGQPAGDQGPATGGGQDEQPDEPPPTPPRSDPAPPSANPDEPGPAQRSGRLWVPGQ